MRQPCHAHLTHPHHPHHTHVPQPDSSPMTAGHCHRPRPRPRREAAAVGALRCGRSHWRRSMQVSVRNLECTLSITYRGERFVGARVLVQRRRPPQSPSSFAPSPSHIRRQARWPLQPHPDAERRGQGAGGLPVQQRRVGRLGLVVGGRGGLDERLLCNGRRRRR